MELDKHKAAQLWSEMTRHVRRHGRRHGLPLRADPAFAPNAHDMRAEHEVLNQEVRIALEARAGRERSDLDDALLIDGQIGARHHLAPTPFAGRPRSALTGLLHAARLEPRP